MYRTRLAVLLTLLLTLTSVSASIAQVTAVPQTMNFQGRLAKPDGTPVSDGTYSVRFSLHSALSGGTETWKQTVGSVKVKNGTFAVSLSGFPANTFHTSQWLEIKIGTNAALTPRQPLVTVPYAFKADMALTVPDGSLTNAKIANGTITADKLAGDAFNLQGWLLGGNNGTNPASHFLGTTDNQPLVLKVNSQRALQMQHVQNGDYLGNNLLGGYWLNSITSGVTGATVFGGVKVSDAESPNRVTDHGGTVGGGKNNRAGNDNATLDDAWLATVSGGAENTASGIAATVGGGASNTAGNDFATVGGGGGNTSGSLYATIAGGAGNTSIGDFATVGGGYLNTASYPYATVAGGYNNTASRYQATVGGGYRNFANGDYATVGGGRDNTASYPYATVGGGYLNTVSGDAATVAGGVGNTANGNFVTVAGGAGNTASFSFSTVGGGDHNTASGGDATVGGGWGNTASGSWSTVGGGVGNTASGGYATVAGGDHNTAAGEASFAAGYRAKAHHDGAFVWADNSSGFGFASTAANQFLLRASGGVGINTNEPQPDTLHIKGNGRVLNLEGNDHVYIQFFPQTTANSRGAYLGFPGALSDEFVIANERPGGVVRVIGTFVNSSDIHLKHDVRPLDNSLDTLLGLRGVSYLWNADGEKGRPQIGFIAQEVEQVLPELVYTDTNGYKSVAYIHVVPLLVEAVRTLKKENEAKLKQKERDIIELRSKLDTVLERLEKLEARRP